MSKPGRTVTIGLALLAGLAGAAIASGITASASSGATRGTRPHSSSSATVAYSSDYAPKGEKLMTEDWQTYDSLRLPAGSYVLSADVRLSADTSDPAAIAPFCELADSNGASLYAGTGGNLNPNSLAGIALSDTAVLSKTTRVDVKCQVYDVPADSTVTVEAASFSATKVSAIHQQGSSSPLSASSRGSSTRTGASNR